MPARPAWSWAALSDHWTFPDRENSWGFVHVVTFTNAETVTLSHTVGYNFVKIFGPTWGRYCSRAYSRQYQNDEVVGVQHFADNPDNMIEWYVPYEPGTLRAVAETDGEVVATHGRDLVYVDARIVDDDGVVAPRADHEIAFSVAGAGDRPG